MWRIYFNKSREVFFTIMILFATVLIIGCADDGDDGKDGVDGKDGQDAIVSATVDPESCAVCHSGVGEGKHQSIYDDYADASTLTLEILGVVSVANGDGTFASTLTFSVEQDGMPVLDEESLEQLRFGWASYDSANSEFPKGGYFNDEIAKTATPGQFTATELVVPFAPELENAQVYGYIADGLLDTESGGHVHMYNDVASAGIAYGDVATYESVANVEGCVKCHGEPYMKHGYRDPVVDGLSDFSSCKICHYDTRNGGHEDWQILVDDPPRFAEVHAGDDLTAAEEAYYAYTANIMNDVHMAHAMEFPYPQAMANCATCHDGKLDDILTDDNFVNTTCRSCHPVTGPEDGTDPHRAPAIETLWVEKQVENFHDIDQACNACHMVGGVGPEFSELHTGYDKVIYNANGVKYSDIFTVSIDDADLTGNLLTVNFSADKDGNAPGLFVGDIVPTLFIGLYGYDSHQYIIYPHGRDDDGNRLLEFLVDGKTVNPRFTTVTAAGGVWEIIADLSEWADMIADDTIKRAEIGVTVDLRTVVGEIDSRSNGETDDTIYGMIAPSRTFDLGTNRFDDDYFKGDNAIVDVESCNACHDLLATTFHSPTRGGNIQICNMCHVTSSRGSHLELASRSTDNYVHAIHSFQPFDPGDVDFTDPVEAVMYDLHIGHVFPNFTIKNCESCHVEGTYNVPDQSRSLPSLHSGTDEFDGDRNIGTLGQFVTGPASRACGACHRAQPLKEDNAGELAAFNQHTKAGGYMVDDEERADDEPSVWDDVVETIMSMFK